MNKSLRNYEVLVSTGRSSRSMLLIALATVYRPGPIRLEGHLCLLAAFRTSNICHFSRTAVVATSAATAIFIFSLKHLIHLPFESIQGIETAPENISANHFESTNPASIKGPLRLYTCRSKKSFCHPYLLLVIMESMSQSLISCSSPTDCPGNLALLPQTSA